MQTFMPFEDFKKSVESLDNRRLGKQRLEAYQILQTLEGKKKGWVNHPAVKMWRGYENALKHYYNLCLDVWESRGFKNEKLQRVDVVHPVKMPQWIGNTLVHVSHQSNLIRKMPHYYKPKFPGVPSDVPYVWPDKI